MKYINDHKKSFSQKFIRSFYPIGFSIIILSFLTLLILLLGIFKYINFYIAILLAFMTGQYAVRSILLLLSDFFYNESSENSVHIVEDSILISYPFPKKNKTIKIHEIQTIIYNNLSKDNESKINLKNDEFGIKSINLNSINLVSWKEFSNKEKIPLLVYYSVDEKPSFNYRMFFQNEKDDNYYIIKNENSKIEEPEWLNYCNRNNKINFIGKVEYFNYTDIEQMKPVLSYIMETIYGNTELVYIDGQIQVPYKNNKNPIEIIQLAKELKCDYTKIR